MEFDILNRHTPCTGLHFLEASAGTGKTFTIEHLVVRLVLQGIPIEQILVVTFTRKATSELKLRIRRALQRTQEELKTGKTSSDYLIALLEKEEQTLKEKRALIHAALICFDAAAIFTLHGFCHRMLTEFAFEGKVASLPSPDEIHGIEYYKRIVRHFLLRKLSCEHYSPIQLSRLLQRVKNDPQRLIDKIAKLLVDGAAIYAYPDLQQQYASFCKELSLLPPVELDLFKEDVERLSACYKGLKKEAIVRETALWSDLLQNGSTQEKFESLLKEEESIFDAFEESNQKVKSRLPEKLYYPNLIPSLKKGALASLKQASCPERTLLRLARSCKMSEPAKVHLSPDQMVERLETALEEEAFLKAVQHKYRAAIIDEFQDTDPTQWTIFKRLFVGSVETLCLVGDPKQSIYAFRRADIYTYLQAKQTLGSDAHRLLNTNYRSCPSLVHALNQLFAAPQGGRWFPLPKNQSAIEVHPVKAGLKEVLDGQRERGRIHFFIASGSKGRSKQWPTLQMEEQQLFPFIAHEAFRIKEKRGLLWEEIAVLVKDRFQAERLITYLKKLGIPASFRKAEATSSALVALTHFVKALLFPSDMSALKVALFGPLIGLSEKEATSDVLKRAKIEMLALAKLLHQEGVHLFFHQLFNVVWPGKERTIAQRLLECKNFDLYTELQILGERLVKEQLQAGDLLTFLKRIDQEDLEVPAQQAPGSLCIMTLHLSKGLEFDTVFALGLASRHATKEGQVLKKENTLFVLDRQESASLEALQEIDAEKMRLLYVALTRAKEQLYVPLALEEGEVEAQEAAPIELFFAKMGQEKEEVYLARLAACSSLTYERIAIEKSPIFEAETPVSLQPPPPIDFLPEPTYLTSFSALAQKGHLEEPFPDQRLPLGAKTGVVLHEIFEAIFAKSLHHPFNKKEIIALINKTDLAEYLETILSLVTNQLHIELLPGFSLIHLPAGQYVQEQEFLYPFESGMMKGVADLWFIYENKYYLLDWKSNSLSDYSRESMEKAMRLNDYFLQASIYKAALKRYVKLFDNRPFTELFGGAFYLFVRGNGVYHFIPEDR